jgi:hypothetical protein
MRRILYEIHGTEPGPTLVGIGGMHGNEPAGVQALERIGRRLEEVGVRRGGFVAVAGNLPALEAGARFLDHDLNRIWEDGAPEASRERLEMSELEGLIDRILENARGPVRLVDLHTTSGEGPPFTATADLLLNRDFALLLPVPMVLGLSEALPGTLIQSLVGSPVAGMAFEAGLHEDPESVRRSEDALVLLLSGLGICRFEPGAAMEARARLEAAGRGHPRALHLTHRHGLRPSEGFSMHPGFRSFQPVRRGEVIATTGAGEVRAPSSGRLLLPLYQSSGEDGFFLGTPVASSWLRLSEWMRRVGADRYLRFLPGFRVEQAGHDRLQVHPGLFRVLPARFFFLLGYRPEGGLGGWVALRRDPEPGEGRAPGRSGARARSAPSGRWRGAVLVRGGEHRDEPVGEGEGEDVA